MKTIKLPRKRKKAFIKAKGSKEYRNERQWNISDFEDEPIKKWTKFPELVVVKHKAIVIFN